jgi:hypothetical protein
MDTSQLKEILDWAFEHRPSNHLAVSREYNDDASNRSILFEVANLTHSLRQAGCERIQEKFVEVSSWSKMVSLKSELFFAYELIKIGFAIKFICDGDDVWKDSRGKQISSPDLLAKKLGREVFVEVQRISGDETFIELRSKLTPLIRKSNLRMEIIYSEVLSLPALNHEERTNRENQISNLVQNLEQLLIQVNPGNLPKTYEILGCKILLEEFPEQGSEQFTLLQSTQVVELTQEQLKQNVIYYLEQKAKKRNHWKPKDTSIPYILAFDINQYSVFSPLLNQWLFGGRISLSTSSKMYQNYENSLIEDQDVTSAKLNGWGDVLERSGFNENEKIGSLGAFRDNNLLNNTSGILVNQGRILFIPNPFADEEINAPDLLTLIPFPMGEDSPC